MTQKTIELYGGARSFSVVAQRLGHQIFTTDYEVIDGQDLVADIHDLTAKDFPYKPDILWASPPCEGFSVASMGANWRGGYRAYIPKTDTARRSIDLVKQALRLIDELKPKYFFIENPQGVLKNLPLLKHLKMHTIWYCKYGDMRAKPTNIWTNAEWFQPRPCCRNYKYDKVTGKIINRHCHHEPARRGAKTGTQGIKGYKNRSRIPAQLFEDIFDQI